MKRMRTAVLPCLIMLVVALIGCKDSTEPTSPVTGTWSGVMQPSGSTMVLTLVGSGASVTGTFLVNGITVNVAGTYSHPSMVLTYAPSGQITATISGVVMTGSILSSNNTTFTLGKQ